MKRIILLLFILYSFASYGQEKTMLVFDLANGTIDTIPIVSYDTTNLSDQTDYYIGSYNSIIETLEQTPPISNTYPNSNFTYKKRASSSFDLSNYPIRTSIKMFFINKDTLSGQCSGSLISRKHVLTAAHCVSPTHSNNIFKDSIIVSPVFDIGILNAQFNSSYVSKIYFFKDWSLMGEDISILELEEPIGELTGWLSIGFNKIDSLLSDGIFYKYSYPGRTILQLDPNEYNGDTLYYNYGNIDITRNTSIGINNTNAIPGESGSSLIKVKNGQEYTSYGVLSYGVNSIHSRIKNWQFYTFKEIIENDLIPTVLIEDKKETFIIYPNPVTNTFYIKNSSENTIISLMIFNNLGQKVLHLNIEDIESGIDISNLLNGVYYLKIISAKSNETKIIIKE